MATKQSTTAYNLGGLLLRELGLVKRSEEAQAQHQHSGATTAVQPQLIPPSESFEQIVNMATLPFYLESFILFGLLSSLNSFLRLVVVLPLEIGVDVILLILSIREMFIIKSPRRDKNFFQYINVSNLVFASLIFTVILCTNVDTSKIYHTIKIQSSIKLYVMFGVLEVSDKLLSTVGQDLLNYTFSRSAQQVSQTPSGFIKCLGFLLASALYLSAHTIVLVYQTIALNVAANSYSNSLVTLLLSNQFAEIKSSVFKRLDREGLFQMSCADTVERFQLLIQLGIIALRNMVQIGSDPQNSGLLPNVTIHGINKWFGVVLGPTAIVIGSELAVDWVKHSYVTKFNKIRPQVYKKYLDVLSQDVANDFKWRHASGSTDRVQQRLGIPLPALFTLLVVMSKDSIAKLFYSDSTSSPLVYPNVAICITLYGLLLTFKLLLQLALLKRSNSILKSKSSPSSATDQSDFVPGITSGGHGAMDQKGIDSIWEGKAKSTSREPKQKMGLNGVTRYRMVSKRIW
ncbi:Emp65p [Cyberlindnera jadinii NRRL Y-1542]|uniref:DUF747-domain-containing protein n=1 Tax=Cyberlindnera jadinii (strain ATCC 18201 / CBS 1600 / BCRC 20928 / JCM 3617 / NBRC 0987 / NRRL Y-1542) TaxID=983966 RepID=A0A1E4RY44_CYBJN|nr:DUF747-domain-containing protein [Cyberlindnera jadinii NRRL Y-1542]ODV72005.1 DUF747-domain-containing protein [Cyberlindnera jadinii NRRL Y-1542]